MIYVLVCVSLLEGGGNERDESLHRFRRVQDGLFGVMGNGSLRAYFGGVILTGCAVL